MGEKKTSYFKKETIIACVIGLVVGVIVMLIIGAITKSTGMANLKYGKDAAASVAGKSISANTIYEKTKASKGLSVLMNEIDKTITRDLYKLTEKEEKEAEDKAKYYLDSNKTSGYTDQDFYDNYGFKSYDEFLQDIKDTEKYNKCLYDILEKKLEEGAVQKYYDDHKDELESYDSEHILVKITDEVTDEQALTLANEIIEKLDSGKTFDEVVEEYKDKIVHENLGFQSKTARLEQPYLDELIALKDGEYSKTPVKTSYGYHIVHRLSTETFEDLRETIIEILSEDLLTNDSGLIDKELIKLREEKGLTIYDEQLKRQYDKYCEQVNK